MPFEQAQRIQNLPPYLFARIERLIEQKRAAGVDIISLGIGDPDQPTPEHIVQELIKEAKNPANHQYPSSAGLLDYRRAVAGWYSRRFGVELDAQSEVVTLIGSKEGIAHISWCYLNPGDTVLLPDPGYPVYAGGAVLAGAVPHYMPLQAENGFLPVLADIPSAVARKAKMMFINYPNNPTGAVAGEEFFREVVAFAREYNILVCHDAAYSEIAYDGYRPPSFLQVPGAKEIGLEFNSVSKPFNMTGWRIGWAAGCPEAVEALGRLKSNLDSGQFQAVQYAAMAGLNGPYAVVDRVNGIYRRRRDMLVEALNGLGWRLEKPRATFYVWAPVPAGYTDASFTEAMLEKAAVVITPGSGYGSAGAGYFRISLTLPTERLQEAVERIKKNIGPVKF
ncbi:LL-diaminopimelate aminotransferase [Desulfotomaculum copahuensis]|uniref:LL-diaminopimelate aminotransferase n=1 Tax=Desulfotomaculum copahuensis TaxID=1838280 RepID=A0A1B7LEB6_9FIRM|nr:LL-diaminopimelate aminotransferase [Desulfotomaculum copahuensis]OAT81430.1 LL-diaminopimelate aminotransferase [Desulfotomaculum copahuensis]